VKAEQAGTWDTTSQVSPPSERLLPVDSREVNHVVNESMSLHCAVKRLKEADHLVTVIKNRFRIMEMKREEKEAKITLRDNFLKAKKEAMSNRWLQKRETEEANRRKEVEHKGAMEKTHQQKQTSINKSHEAKMLMLNSRIEGRKKLKTESQSND
jgi:hypothetical protein